MFSSSLGDSQQILLSKLLLIPPAEERDNILRLYEIPNSDSKKVVFLHVINYHTLEPGIHKVRLQKMYNIISLYWELPADKEERFMCLLFP